MSLFESLRTGRIADARAILKADPALAVFREPNGVSAVVLARALGHAEFAREIADVHPGLDPFEAAALGDDQRLVELLDEGAPVDARDETGETPLAVAVRNGHLETARLLLERGADPNTISTDDAAMMPLHLAVSGGFREIAALLVRSGAEPGEPTGADWTPLHYAAANGDEETTRLLIDAGARSGYANRDGHTALELAEEGGHREVARLLAESAV